MRVGRATIRRRLSGCWSYVLVVRRSVLLGLLEALRDITLRVRSARSTRTVAGVIQLVECQLPKLDVTGSSPVARSITRCHRSKKRPPHMGAGAALLIGRFEWSRIATIDGRLRVSFRAQRLGRVDVRGPPCREITRGHRDGDDERNGRRKRHWIAGTHSVQHPA